MGLVFILEDDPLMAECMARVARRAGLRPQVFADALSAMAALETALPDLILLDILLTGPDGFTFLNELLSYTDTATIPVIIATSLDLAGQDLSHYDVVAVLQKEQMTPQFLQDLMQKCCKNYNTLSSAAIQPDTSLANTAEQSCLARAAVEPIHAK